MKSLARPLLTLLLSLYLVGCAYGRHIERGDNAYARGDFETALVEYQAAQAEKPDSEEARDKIAATERELAALYSDEVTRALSAGEYLVAADTARGARATLPANPVSGELVEQVSVATLAHADALAGQQSYARALALYEGLIELLPSAAAQTDPRIDTLKRRWTAILSERGAAAAQAKRAGDALLLYTKAAQLSGAPEHEARAAALRAQLLSEYRYVVAIAPPGGAEAEAVTTALGQVAVPPGLRLQAAPSATAQPANAALTLTMATPNFDVQTSSRVETATFQSGTQLVKNPRHKDRRRALEREEQRLSDDEDEVARYEAEVAKYQQRVADEGDTPDTTTGAEQALSGAQSNLKAARRDLEDQRREVRRARKRLADEPHSLEEPVYSDLSYTVMTQTLIAEAGFSAALTHSDGRAELREQQVLVVDASDEGHPAQPTADVPEDPIILPERGELVAELRQQALNIAAALIYQSFRDWRETLLAAALSAPSTDDRVDRYVIYLVTDPEAPVPTPPPVDLDALRGIPNAELLLGQP